jgi:hypothetical protein
MVHIGGVGATVLLKSYYDASVEVGHLESMLLVIRSRLWLFPGVVSRMKRVKRSELIAKRRAEVLEPPWEVDDDKKGTQVTAPEAAFRQRDPFDMKHFLKRSKICV